MQTPRPVFTYALATVEGVLSAFLETWNQHDMEGLANLFAEEADFVNVLGMRLKGKTAIAAVHRELHKKRFARTEIRQVHCDFAYLSREVALVHLHWEMTGDTEASGDGIRRGLMSHVLIRRDGRWYFRATQNTDIVHSHLSSDPFWAQFIENRGGRQAGAS